MKKYFKIAFWGIILYISMTGCSDIQFDGSRTSNDVQFIIDYSVLNKTETHEMNLEKDQVIDVSIENASGIVDVIVSDSDGDEIYRGNDVETIAFKLTIPKTSKYTFNVTGSNAKGSVSFKIAE